MTPQAPLHILIITQYFWPENMRINDLVEGFVSKGHQVTVLTGIPNYPEGKIYSEFKDNPEKFSTYKGAKIIRAPIFLRGKHNVRLALNYLSFFISASVFGFYRLRKQRFDAIFVYAASPILSAIPAIAIGKLKKIPVFIWVLDLWPESLRATGVINNQKLLNLVGFCVSWIYDRADYILIQSQAFAENICRYCNKTIEQERIIFFPSWAEEIFSDPSDVSDLISKDESIFTIVFAGNIGHAQGFPSILEAARTLSSESISIRWVIVGDGRARAWVAENIRASNLTNVLLPGRHPVEKMPALFSIADALLVSLKTNEVLSRTIPGKVQSYLAAGRPIIAMMDGEGARIIKEAQAGMACASDDAAGLARIVRIMAGMTKEQRESMGRAGREYYLKHFSRQSLFNQLEHLFYRATLRSTTKIKP